MKPSHALLCSLVLTPALLLWFQLSQPEGDNSAIHILNGAGRPAAAVPEVSISANATSESEDISADDTADNTLTESAAQLNSKAIAQLRRSIEHGEPRAPAVAADQRQYQRIDENVRANRQAYSAYQSAQQLQRRATYVYAAGKKLAEIDAQMEWGRKNGVSDAQLAMAQEKRDRLAKAREQLLKDHPDIPDMAISPEPLQQK